MENNNQLKPKIKYHPFAFFATALFVTWFWWSFAILSKDEVMQTVYMIIGVLSPSLVAISFILFSRSKILRRDFIGKAFGLTRINFTSIVLAVLVMLGVVTVSILVSLLFGQPSSQFGFTEDFSFTGPGIASAFVTILIASIVEEIGWRGYGEDSLAQSHSWFEVSLIFGAFWALWHFPLLFVPGSYQHGLLESNIWFAVNFFLSALPMAFMTMWVYVKNNRSMLDCMAFHLFINFMQEKIALTPTTKCIETAVLIVVVVLIVSKNKEIFFSRKHIGNLPYDVLGTSNVKSQ